MKKINFFSFPSCNIVVKKDSSDDINIKSDKKNHLKFTKTKFNSWCSSINRNSEKLNFVVTIKSE